MLISLFEEKAFVSPDRITAIYVDYIDYEQSLNKYAVLVDVADLQSRTLYGKYETREKAEAAMAKLVASIRENEETIKKEEK